MLLAVTANSIYAIGCYKQEIRNLKTLSFDLDLWAELAFLDGYSVVLSIPCFKVGNFLNQLWLKNTIITLRHVSDNLS